MILHRYQLWPQIAALTVLLTALGCIYLIPFAWQWGADWPPFEAHWPHLRKAVVNIALQDYGAMHDYFGYLRENELTSTFAAHVLVPFCSVISVSLLASLALLYRRGGRDPSIHISGPSLLCGRTGVQHAASELREELKKPNSQKGVHLHPDVSVTKARELGNLLVFGQQGSGKSVVIKPILAEVIARSDSVMVYDEKREYTALFFDQSTALISPTDERSLAWNLSSDITSPEQAFFVAECLIPDQKGDEFWVNGARLLLTGVFVVCIRLHEQWSWQEVNAVLGLDEGRLKELFELHYPQAARLIEKESKTTQGFMTILAVKLNWIDSLARAWPTGRQDSFSIADWVNGVGKYRTLIIASDPMLSSISAPLCNAILSLATRYLLSLGDSPTRRVWFVIDEVGNLPRCDALLKLCTLGRSKGSRLIAGTQSISQLYSIYGQDAAETLLALFSNVVCLRLGAAGQSARRASELFGERTIQRPSESFDGKGGRSTSYQHAKELLVQPEAVTQLPQASSAGVTGYLLVSGWEAVFRLTWPITKIPAKALEYQAATWLVQSNTKAKRNRKGRRQRTSC